MDDFPMWLKVSMWVILGSAVLWAIGGVLYQIL